MMTYSYVHRAINSEAFPNALDLYDKQLMTGRGRGRYSVRRDWLWFKNQADQKGKEGIV